MNTLILIIGFVVLIKIIYDGMEKIWWVSKDIWNLLRRWEERGYK